MRAKLIILIIGYLVIRIMLIVAFERTPINAIKDSFEFRGKLKTLIFFMISPLIFIQNILEVSSNKLEKFIDNCMD